MAADENQANDLAENFVCLLAKHERRLEGYVLSLMPNWADAEEVLQETKLRLWQQYHEYDPAKDFGAWACTIAYYQVLTLRNRSRAEHSALGQAFLDKVAAEVARRSDRAIDRQRLMAECLQKLAAAKLALLKRCYAGQETIAQIADELGRKADAVRQELLRIRQTLHRCVDQASRQEEES